MTLHSHQTAPTRFVESNGIRFACRRFGIASIWAGETDKWGVQQEGSYDHLKAIKQPTLVVNGSNDVIMPTVNSFIMEQNIPNAQLIIYPDSNHGSRYQHPELSVGHVSMFLS